MSYRMLDCKGLSCPIPIIKLSQQVKKLPSGQTIEILSTDPAFHADIQAWANKTGNKLQGKSQDGSVYKAVIQKK